MDIFPVFYRKTGYYSLCNKKYFDNFMDNQFFFALLSPQSLFDT